MALASALTGRYQLARPWELGPQKNFSAMDHLNETIMKKGKALAKTMAVNATVQNTVFTSFNRRNRINPNANLLLDPRSRNRNGIDSRLSDWNELLENLGELEQIAVETDNPVAAEKLLRTRNKLEKNSRRFRNRSRSHHRRQLGIQEGISFPQPRVAQPR